MNKSLFILLVLVCSSCSVRKNTELVKSNNKFDSIRGSDTEKITIKGGRSEKDEYYFHYEYDTIKHIDKNGLVVIDSIMSKIIVIHKDSL